MRATRIWVLAWLLVLGSGALASCGKDEAAFSPVSGTGGAEAGARTTPEGGAESEGGTTSTAGSMSMGGTSPTGGASLGGVGPTPSEGGSAEGGTLVVGASGSEGIGGATPEPGGEQLEVCDRLNKTVSRARAALHAFSNALALDCRVKWLFPVKDDLSPYLNGLLDFDLEFWGCQGQPVSNFALVYGAPSLSAGDARILIEHYLATTNATDAELDLSEPERAEMKAALERLAGPLITSDSDEPSQPACSVSGAAGAGGAGGAGGTGSAGGAGGTQ